MTEYPHNLPVAHKNRIIKALRDYLGYHYAKIDIPSEFDQSPAFKFDYIAGEKVDYGDPDLRRIRDLLLDAGFYYLQDIVDRRLSVISGPLFRRELCRITMDALERFGSPILTSEDVPSEPAHEVTEHIQSQVSEDKKVRQAGYAAKHREKAKAVGRPDARAVQAAVFDALSHQLWIARRNNRSGEVLTMQGILMAAAVALYKDYDKKQVLEKIVSMRGDNPFPSPSEP
ncbi:hypothetical protein N1937_02055 [Rhizobium sp. WSM4643]|uniref:hypothetical protein n=1 Tax=Rhizobium sp. WSM4643 TaxID=3138253 RepID=UPI0021A58F04|nr:hypothetical protein [Rhizobium leguminosarum]UWM76056.1 hypothetical protein N1937_02055 [Rhizobium leguminosarum bv. viciae]